MKYHIITSNNEIVNNRPLMIHLSKFKTSLALILQQQMNYNIIQQEGFFYDDGIYNGDDEFYNRNTKIL